MKKRGRKREREEESGYELAGGVSVQHSGADDEEELAEVDDDFPEEELRLESIRKQVIHSVLVHQPFRLRLEDLRDSSATKNRSRRLKIALPCMRGCRGGCRRNKGRGLPRLVASMTCTRCLSRSQCY